MKNKNTMRKIVLTAMIGTAAMSMTACGTSLADNTGIFFDQVSTAINNYSSKSAAEAQIEATNAKRIASPENVSFDVSTGTWAFDAVEEAAGYKVSLCKVADGTADEVMSTEIESDGSASYTGVFSSVTEMEMMMAAMTGTEVVDHLDLSYGDYYCKVVAIPAEDNTGALKSKGVKAEFTKSGEVADPVVEYFWDSFSNTLTLQVSNMADYAITMQPDSIDFTLSSASGDVTVTLESPDYDSKNYNISTTELTADAEYAITATSHFNETYVTNAEVKTEAGSVTAYSNRNVITENFGYIHSNVNYNIDVPAVCEGFNLAEGGVAGVWNYYYYLGAGDARWDLNSYGEPGDVYYSAAPAAAADGAEYTYDITSDVGAAGSGYMNVWCSMADLKTTGAVLPGRLSLYSDGTLKFEIYGAHYGTIPMINTSSEFHSCEVYGTWIDNGDGTATLSYDLSTLTGTDYFDKYGKTTECLPDQFKPM